MLTLEENELLCRVGPSAPMGRMLRRYWLPALLPEELEAGGAPKRLRLLGEDLVAFRNTEGRVGVLDHACPHRGASLVLGRNEECGLTCLYHGWRVGVDGTILDAPTMPPGSPFTSRVRHLAYPVVEAGGFVWVFMGAGELPALPRFPFVDLPSSHRVIMKVREEANWVQALEGVLDSAHTNFLHADYVKPSTDTTSTDYKDGSISGRASADGRPRLEIEDTPYGFRYAAIRRPVAFPDKNHYVRTTLFIAPFYGMNAQPPGWGQVQVFVPMDDTHTMFYNVRYSSEDIGPIADGLRENMMARFGARVGVDVDVEYRKHADSSNLWLQDRAAMQRGDSLTGLAGVATQDMACQESMGPIVDRTKEHLGPTDLAIIRMRRTMLESLRDFVERGIEPVGLRGGFDYADLRADEGLVPIGAPWQQVRAVADEILLSAIAKG